MEPSTGTLLGDASQHPQGVLHPSGLLDHAAAAELRAAISRTLSRGPAKLVIDLSAVTDVETDGVAVVIYACRAATAAHVKLVLYAPSPFLLQLLEPTRLSGSYDIEPKAPTPVHINTATT